jgi:hypothetical protein
LISQNGGRKIYLARPDILILKDSRTAVPQFRLFAIRPARQAGGGLLDDLAGGSIAVMGGALAK